MTRRQLLSLPFLSLPCTGLRALGQMASRGVKPIPRGKPSGLPFDAHFVNVASQAGLRAPMIFGGLHRNDYIVESMGCGIAYIDYDNDGWLDIVQLTGRRMEDTPKDAIIRLYRNNRDGTFTDVTKNSGIGRSVWAYGITVADYDNDGFDDIFITCWGRNILFHNNRDGTFTDVTGKACLAEPGNLFSTGCTWIDYDRDGKLDLFVTHYVGFDLATVPPEGKNPACNFKGVLTECGPRGLPKQRCRLYHNNGDGTFTDVSAKSGISAVRPGYNLTAVAADFDDDGWPDLYVACDTSPSLLYRNKHDGTFDEEGLEDGVALNEDGQEQAGMGLGIGDFNTDGYLDILKTHFAEDTPALYENDGKGSFRDVTIRAGLGVETRFVCWGAGMIDLDNDGAPDLFFTTGMVYPEVESRFPAFPHRTPSVLYRNLGNGRFEELLGLPGVSEPHSGRGVAFGDFDNDGDIDILIANMNEPPTLLRNDLTGGNHWLKVKLVGTRSNRSAIGAQAIVSYGSHKQTLPVLAQSSYLSVNDRRLHCGLGKETTADIAVRWPNGERETFTKVAADQLVTIREGSGIVAREPFPAKGSRRERR
jgi:enediyne biosynthesis protein E4